MKGDHNLLQLLHIPLQTKELLPESSGIYYVLDETQKVWYIGQAKNICKRWKGKTHHRIDQLEAQKKTQFTIYYELVSKDQLDEVEKQRIEKYHPHLNESPVKAKKVLPTETLLRETLVAISDFVFILGIEPPRKDIADSDRNYWWFHKKLLSLDIIHISIDITAFKEKYNFSLGDGKENPLIKASLNSRKTYSSNWESVRYIDVYRLYVNGYAIELHVYDYFYYQEKIQEIRKYHDVKLAGRSIKAVTPESLSKMQSETDRQYFHSRLFQRMRPYDTDLIRIFFNDPIDEDKIKNKITTIREDYKTGKRGYGSRSKKSGTTTVKDLLHKRHIDPQKYSKEGAFRFLRGTDKIGLFVKSFSTDLKRPYKHEKYRFHNDPEDTWRERDLYNSASGYINSQKTEANSWQFETLYLLASVDRQSWLLVEEYLQDFASVNRLDNGVGYITKFYVSPRKWLVPAKVNIKILEVGSGFGIPFGPTDDFPTFETAKEEIKRRLEASDLPEMKLTFQREKVT
ncbi:GIY-YIG nuclease family protein [Roseofilum sp. Guam]|uniref:GIY-YIG nuclease family protein n=1 Tax=Roseofilum sp. Guam TaxID=2821502 RepID=UPI001B00C0D8|nr:GIY-YIG nuclease family protein [Roseofilum sp. Guam]MBP0030597.1 GIY-YIG nuclease family protein [Roseofilum sp. Guam]